MPCHNGIVKNEIMNVSLIFPGIFLKSDHKCSLLLLVKVDVPYTSMYYIKFADIHTNMCYITGVGTFCSFSMRVDLI